jgi:hypothetical protein
MPYVTEYGALMAASVLNTPRKVEVSIYVGPYFRQTAETL